MPKRKPPAPNLSSRKIGPAGAEIILYRWNIGPRLRAGGFKAVDLWTDGSRYSLEDSRAIGFLSIAPLRHKGKTPCPFGEASRISAALTSQARAQLAEKRRRNGEPVKVKPVHRQIKTWGMLFDDFLEGMEKKIAAGELAAKTFENYKVYIGRLQRWAGPEPIWLDGESVITKEILGDFLAAVKLEHGVQVAYKTGSLFTRACRWAEGRDKWFPLLPDARVYRELDLEKPGGRLRVGLPVEMETLLLAFDHPATLYAELETPIAERVLTPAPSMGDALVALLWSCARVNDGLSFLRTNFETGRLIYKQHKTDAILDLPVLGALKERLPAMLARREAIRAPDNYGEIIINELDGAPYWRERKSGIRDHKPFNDRWPLYRDLAAKKVPSLAGVGVDRLGRKWKKFHAQDTRDTACSRLVLAGCDLLKVASWHGSSVEEVGKLAKHYLEITGATADEAGELLEAMCRKQGITV